MSQWEYVVKEARLWGKRESNPEVFPRSGSTLPEEKQRLKESFNESTIVNLSEFGQELQVHLDELGAAGWEVYHIERLEIQNDRLYLEVNYRFFAKRRRSE